MIKSQVTDIMNLQNTIAQARKAMNAKKEEESKIAVVEVEPENTLPSTYISANQLKLSAKELTHTTSYLDRIRQSDDRYEAVKITEEKAKKIRRGLIKLTTGSASVVPLKCNGADCSFTSTCLTGDTKVLMQGGVEKEIRDLRAGDLIYSVDTLQLKTEPDVVVRQQMTGIKHVFKLITLLGNSITATADHLFLTVSDTLVQKWDSLDKTLKIGSTILVTDFSSTKHRVYALGDAFEDQIIDIEYMGQEEVYDITVQNNQNFIANNIIVHNCPYFLEGVAPVGLACLVELQLIEYWMEKYQSEFNVTDESITDMHMIARLCEYDIYDMRVTRYLAEHDQTLLTDFVSSYAEDGSPITNKATSAAFEVKERIDRLRSKTLKELMATREAKAKILTAVTQGEGNLTLSQMKRKFDELVRDKTDLKVVN